MRRILSLLILFAITIYTANAQNSTPAKTESKSNAIKGTIQLSALLSSGNVDASNFTGALLLQTSTGALHHAAMFDYQRTSQEQAGSKVEYTVQYIEYQMSFPITGPIDGIIGGEIEDNEIRQIDYRYTGYAGARFQVAAAEKVELKFTAAGGYADQKFEPALGNLHQDFPVFYTGADLTWAISPQSQFSNELNYFSEFTTETEHRLMGAASVKSQITKNLALTLQFKYDYSSREFDYLLISQQNEPWDLTFTAGLQAQF